ncbi:hypothetical protein B1C78_12160 [Thioalkalivibrio denitrificans]|uniref:Ceramidase n=2 Tax=Thioalkalivibrio denitrificans TaxID=108003 RepID=A0A1V3NEE1_9GAMM|nr:hypothetical protein B1C78_12160 [Thioalkalivibrio denitrificans]
MDLPTYCERASDGLLAEPLNAVTNAAFLAAAWLAWRRWRAQPGASWRHQADIGLLIALLALIGIGSLLWHTVSRPWAFWLDALPITFFIHVFLFSFLWRLARLGWPAIIAVFVAYEALTFLVLYLTPAGALNDSAGYLPVVLFLWLMGAGLRLRDHPLWRDYLGFGALFAVSLGFRIADPLLCDLVPVGTHFLWHVLNGWLLYLLLAGLIRHGIPDRSASS